METKNQSQRWGTELFAVEVLHHDEPVQDVVQARYLVEHGFDGCLTIEDDGIGGMLLATSAEHARKINASLANHGTWTAWVPVADVKIVVENP